MVDDHRDHDDHKTPNGDADSEMVLSRNNPERGEYATQESYDEQTKTTEDVVVPDGEQRFCIQHESPFKFANLLESAGIDVDTPDGARQVPDASMDETDISQVQNTIAAFREIVIPNIVRPQYPYWDDAPSDYPADHPELFDVSSMTQDDLLTLIAAITQQDADDLRDQAHEQAAAMTDGGQPVSGTDDERYEGRFR